ncbi:M50 family metallopeptidase [Gordonia bronchialis]|uniref:M50 family metallopeptidase n=1 Tax=Gordonia bronchialis TaxID=2054 RepID=UPI001CC07926|nr:M50 family metallopeptidase [Gordonia bronchialis]UAK38815.1 M50 family metallopeptidase [Gordonia bronchialis]
MTTSNRAARQVTRPARIQQRTAPAPPTPETSTMTAAQRARYALAVHESAHAVVATVLGHEVNGVTLNGDNRTGTCTITQRFGGAPSAEIAYAGIYGEAFYLSGGPPSTATLRAVLTRQSRDERAMTAAGDPRPAQVPRLVVNCWASISLLANRVYTNGSATQADVDAALQIPCDDEDGRGAALAAIRSGSAPGSFTITPVGSRR